MLTTTEKADGLAFTSRARAAAATVRTAIVQHKVPNASLLIDLFVAAGLALEFYAQLKRDLTVTPTGSYIKETIFRAALEMESLQHQAATLMATHYTPQEAK